MNDELNRDAWRQHYSKLTLILDQASAFCSLGNAELARERVDDAKLLVEAAKKHLESNTEGPPRFLHLSEPGPALTPNEVAMVGPLTESLYSKDNGTRDAGRSALSALLVRVRHEDQYLINAHQRRNLYRLLQMDNAPTYADLLIAVLQALTQIEDIDALKTVHRLAESEAFSKQCKRVRAVAQNCRDILETVKTRSELNGSLLRPSGSPEGPSSLLRPAVNTQGADGSLLLHPTSEHID